MRVEVSVEMRVGVIVGSGGWVRVGVRVGRRV